MKIKTALYSLFSRLDWHKNGSFPVFRRDLRRYQESFLGDSGDVTDNILPLDNRLSGNNSARSIE
ncbi:hypothetical protein HMPREF9008_03666 [Parabacteroides sp. 20_3]|nr:hypothetical protein HMPREF9008_03666 [Parabacteroides sp. 20_3]